MIDFYRYREELKKEVLRRRESLRNEWDAFNAAWLAYALSQDGFENNLPLLDLIDDFSRWAQNEEAWCTRRNIGPLCLYAYVQHSLQKADLSDLVAKILQNIEILNSQEVEKFSPLNYPEQVFGISIFLRSLDSVQDLKESLCDLVKQRSNGTIKRRLVFAASLHELGKVSTLTDSGDQLTDPGDIIALTWFRERYGPEEERASGWKIFASIKEQLTFSENSAQEGERVLSTTEIAMLYESLVRETKAPDPNLLFDFHPLHPRVREIAEKLFKEIAEGVDKNKAGRALAQQLMGGTSPKIKFNTLTTRSEKDEQDGLKLLTEGIFAAFRNPKGHEPMDAPAVQISPLEAIDQLIVVSYIFKRIDEAQVAP